MKYLLLLIFAAFTIKANAQGCVAIRSNGSACTLTGGHIDGQVQHSNWLFGINNRYFKSYKHFVGKEEQHERVENGTEVINYFVSAELGVTRQFNDRWSLAFYAPIISNVRSSLYEHYGNASKDPNARNTTKSFGLGDVRLSAYYWILNPVKASRGNIQLGLGVKLPTGDYRVQDYFHLNDTTKVLGPVDQSIQLGDGGTGITTELNAFYALSKGLSIYGNFFYLLNPREHNGVLTSRGRPVATAALAYGSDVMSVPDQYMARLGATYGSRNLSFSGGLRLECLPAEDLIGGSNGFRRPGYVLSVEPVVAYKVKRTQLYVSVPVAVVRNRVQSVPDKIRTQITGTFAQGDAAFADYTVNFGAAFALK